MDAFMNQLARELAEVMSEVVGADSKVQAFRDKARAAGYDVRVALDASVTFVPIDGGASRTALVPVSGVKALPPAASSFEMTATDRRFLKSLRISSDETTEKEVE